MNLDLEQGGTIVTGNKAGGWDRTRLWGALRVMPNSWNLIFYPVERLKGLRVIIDHVCISFQEENSCKAHMRIS